MELENRYIVLKTKDTRKLPERFQHMLDDVCYALNKERASRGAEPLESLVIEKDWPEYEPALAMLSARVDGTEVDFHRSLLNHTFGKLGARPLPNCRSQLPTGHEPTTFDPFGDGGNAPVVKAKHSHYYKDVSHLDHIDVYRVLQLFNVTDPCLQHAIKKLLVAGGRGAGKDVSHDIQEAIDSLLRVQEMEREDSDGSRFPGRPGGL